MIASSRVESVNVCLKHLLYNSNVSLCDLAKEIHRLLDLQDKENEYKFWRLAIPNIKKQQKTNFLFTKIDQYLQEFFTPTMLKIHHDEIDQSLYYTATLFDENADFLNEKEDSILLSDEVLSIDIPQTLLSEFVENENTDNEYSNLKNKYDDDDDSSDKENNDLPVPLLQNQKQCHS
ncbi:hypothetical protein RclHR1_16010004 [Rhizophagus clarus]|nr:hypothetical protein RclHR1_16010004 [Rhizophagus clarus]